MDHDGYFRRVHSYTPTRLWINNPTHAECDLAIAAGAIACTTNPTFVAKQLARSDAEATRGLVRSAARQCDSIDEATDLVQRDVVRPIVDRFRPLWDAAPGQQGFVSVQGNPSHDDDPSYMVAECLRARDLGPNVIAKVPVVGAGIEAIERLIGENMAVIATEVMAIDQATAICEAYRRVAAETGNRPPLYVTHISGIFDDHLRNVVEREGIRIDDEVLRQAGLIVARKQYRLMRERNYPGTLLGGGARGLHHFTELVGGALHVTINWEKSADQLLAQNPPVVDRMSAVPPQRVVDELLEKLPDFRRAYQEGSLEVDAFADYGPVVLFRSSFLAGWRTLEDALRAEGGAW